MDQITAIKYKTQYEFPYYDNSVQQVYDHLKEKGSHKDLIVFFNLVPLGAPRSGNFGYSPLIHHVSGVHPVFVRPKWISSKYPGHHSIYYVDFSHLPEVKKLFFVAVSDDEVDKAHDALWNFLKGTQIGSYAVFELTFKEGDKQKQYTDFLTHLISRTPMKHRIALYDTLLYYMYKDKNKTSFEQLLEEYEQLEPFLDESSPFYNLPSRAIFKEKMEYFKSLNWH